jgi:hypothetical protein
MADQDPADTQFNVMTSRLLRREALRRAAEELNTTSGPGLEGVLARISAEVTADAIDRALEARATVTGASSVAAVAATGTPPRGSRR